jgi:hypothetical protein
VILNCAAARSPAASGDNEVDSELDGSPEYSNRLIPVLGLLPDSLAGNSHRAEAEPVDMKVTSDQEFSGVSRR